MRGLLVKDILGMKSFFKFFLVMIAICTVIAVASESGAFSAGIVASVSIFIGGMMGFTSFAYDTAYGWDSYVLTMPYTRKQIVLSKYLFSLLITGIGAGLGLLLNMVLVAAGVSAQDASMWKVLALLFCMVGIFISIMIPLVFRYGIEKARIIVIIVFIVPFMLLATLGGQNGASGMLDVIDQITLWLPFAAIGALVVSYFIAVHVYTNKEV